MKFIRILQNLLGYVWIGGMRWNGME